MCQLNMIKPKKSTIGLFKSEESNFECDVTPELSVDEECKMDDDQMQFEADLETNKVVLVDSVSTKESVYNSIVDSCQSESQVQFQR